MSLNLVDALLARGVPHAVEAIFGQLAEKDVLACVVASDVWKEFIWDWASPKLRTAILSEKGRLRCITKIATVALKFAPNTSTNICSREK